MRKKRKILIALLIASILMVSTGVLVAASSSDCAHIWEETRRDTGEIVSKTATTCTKRFFVQKLCLICNELETGYENVVYNHDNRLIRSSCNGSKQTYECRICGYDTLTVKSCPSAPHTGVCPNLNG